MEKQTSWGTITYLSSLSESGDLSPRFLPKTAYTLIFTLRSSVWYISNPGSPEDPHPGSWRGPFLFISIHEPHYREWPLETIHKEGRLTVDAIHTILEIIENMSKEKTGTLILLGACVNRLIMHLSGKSGVISHFSFRELQIVYDTINGIGDSPSLSQTSANRLILESKIPKHRFQRACLDLFGFSLQSVIQHHKMKKAFEDIVVHHKTPHETARATGFKHYGNFSTSFHTHFGITPGNAISFPRAS